jgi:DNA topoisomerase-3
MFQLKFIRPNNAFIGPCQFPTLGFVVERYWQRENFILEKFWSLSVTHSRDGIDVLFSWDRQRLFDRLCCLLLYERCIQSPMATVKNVLIKQTKNL